jgi:hypothetical protein
MSLQCLAYRNAKGHLKTEKGREKDIKNEEERTIDYRCDTSGYG